MSSIKQNKEKEKDFEKKSKDDDLAIGTDNRDDRLFRELNDSDDEDLGGPDDGNKQNQPATEKKDEESVKFEEAIETAQQQIAEDVKKEEKSSDTNKTKSNDGKKYEFDKAIRDDIDKAKGELINAAKEATTSGGAVKFVNLVLMLKVASLDEGKRNMLANAIGAQFHSDEGIVIHFVSFYVFHFFFFFLPQSILSVLVLF